MRAYRSIHCLLLLFIVPLSYWAANGQARPNAGRESMTDEEVTKETALEYLRTINRALRKPAPDETRVLGTIQNIDCRNGILFTIRTDVDTFTLKSKNFTSLALNAFRPVTNISSVGCDAELGKIKSLITYTEDPRRNSQPRGDMVSVEFVPDDFRLLSDAEMNSSIAFDPESKVTSDRESAGILREMNRELFRAGPGEKRDIGYLDQIECTSNGSYLHIRTNTQTLKLFAPSIPDLKIRLFTRELGGMEFGCAMKPINVPIVFVFKELRNSNDLADGEIFTLEFVPRNFILDLYPVS